MSNNYRECEKCGSRCEAWQICCSTIVKPFVTDNIDPGFEGGTGGGPLPIYSYYFPAEDDEKFKLDNLEARISELENKFARLAELFK